MRRARLHSSYVPLAFDRERIRKIVHEIGERLEGDWLLVGRALVALWLESERTTEDLDVVWIRGPRRIRVWRSSGWPRGSASRTIRLRSRLSP